MENNKHIGSSFESFLEEEGIFEEVNVTAVKSVLARSLLVSVHPFKQAEQKLSKK